MRSKKKIIVALALPLLVLIGCYLLFQISKSRTFQFFGGLTARVSTNEKVVALTFDDAPTIHTREVLDILKEKNVQATFYIIGNNLEKLPQEGEDIFKEGHELGNHSYSHQRFLLKTQLYIDNEVQKTNDLIRKTGYTGEITFRPPNGKKLFGLPWYLLQHHIKTIMWDVEPDTYTDSGEGTSVSAEFIKNYTIENTKPGSIILLHPFCDTCTADREALPEIIDSLHSSGYSFVTVSDLLKYQ